ncbi:PREDICTED: protein EXORDIUM-like 2 [Theobroma cacao]|uniref:Protein EXORDIUM-like 2 n=1 Tax=Theobroma cacao TaxID=3641 RepID=A0AB32UV75_THECC|nr:PREDICTED: protein EXORDIUM-like 2 [Theobroma cacao]
MGFYQLAKIFPLVVVLIHLSLADVCLGARRLTSLYQAPTMALSYHKGALLEGNLPVSILWYGEFSPAQKSIIADFLLSLNPQKENLGPSPVKPLVSHWWNTIQTYMKKAGKKDARIVLANQVTDRNCSLGKILKKSQISRLARRVHSKPGGLTIVLTAKDVSVEAFCLSNCGFHSSNAKEKSVFIWVGNSVTQCPGQCAWPFHQPIYGPQTAPLGAPNGDVGVDGMIINIASLLAGAVTNPFGNGYFLGSAGAELEVASACPGVYGKGAHPGYAGELLMDRTTGASYNAQGVNGRKYLLPALFDPLTSQCSTLV